MFTKGFEYFLIAALAVVTVLLYLGRADFLLKTKGEKKKRTKEEELKFSRGYSYFTGGWMLAEIVLCFFGDIKGVSIAYIVVVFALFVGILVFSKKSS